MRLLRERGGVKAEEARFCIKRKAGKLGALARKSAGQAGSGSRDRVESAPSGLKQAHLIK